MTSNYTDNAAWRTPPKTALLMTADGRKLYGYGLGTTGIIAAEICFNTAMTGYQEILTDPSYAGQIVTFTFPHIGNIGINEDDIETSNTGTAIAAAGLIIREKITEPANYRAQAHLQAWLEQRGLIGMSGVDTRAITAFIRDNGMFNAVLAHAPDGNFDEDAMRAALAGCGDP